MAKEVKFSIRLQVAGHEELVTATAGAHDLEQALDEAKVGAERFKESLIGWNNLSAGGLPPDHMQRHHWIIRGRGLIKPPSLFLYHEFEMETVKFPSFFR